MEHSPCSHRFKCLICSDIEMFCDCTSHSHQDHPRQQVISDSLLLSRFGTKTDAPEFLEINIYNCPYCDRRSLSIAALYDHLTLEHLDIPFCVRCPVCICFGDNHSLLKDGHLSTHIVDEHSASWEQYDEHMLVYNSLCDDQGELLRFIASTLPPTYSGGASSSESTMPGQENLWPGRTCSICLDIIRNTDCRELPCKHKYHSGCIDLWMKQSPTCPVCRNNSRR